MRQFGEWDETRQDEWFESDWSGGSFEVLLCDEVPCGYLFIEETVECIRIRELVLLPEYQGRGIGSSLLCDAMDRAKQGRLPLTLEVLHENRARDLYRSLGFRECGGTETHVRMQWDEEVRSSTTGEPP